jgi:hypothetical protein
MQFIRQQNNLTLHTKAFFFLDTTLHVKVLKKGTTYILYFFYSKAPSGTTQLFLFYSHKKKKNINKMHCILLEIF